MVDLSTYQPPGVYVSDVSLPYADTINPTLTDRVVCLVGPSRGYQSAIESLLLSKTSPTPLVNPNVMQNTRLVVKSPTGSELTLNTHYTVSVDSSDVDQQITSITLTSGYSGATGLFQVSYDYVAVGYYQPQSFTSYASLGTIYGAPFTDDPNATEQVASPLSLGAKIAFENGANKVLVVAVEEPDNVNDSAAWANAFTQAYSMVSTNPSVDLIVPMLPTGLASTESELAAHATELRTHIADCYNNGFARMGIIGASTGWDDSTDSLPDALLPGGANKRMVLVYPTSVNLYNPNLNKTITVGGTYLAAAIAGRLMMNPVQRGVTRQVLSTITGIPSKIAEKMNKSTMDSLAKAGVLVCMYDRSGSRVVVRHGITTDVTTLLNREISLVRIGDTLLQDVQGALDNSGLIGAPITVDTVIQVKSVLTGALEQEISNQVILSYAGVSVKQQQYPTGDPSVIACTFQYKPAAPLNYITVSFSVDLTYGVVSSDTTNDTNV